MSYTCLEYLFEDGTKGMQYVPDVRIDDDDKKALHLMSGSEWDDLDDDTIEDLTFIHDKGTPALPSGAHVTTTCRVYMYSPTWEELCKHKK